MILPISAQNINLSGDVLDSEGYPVIGATITIKDKPGVGTISDLDGKFTLEVNVGEEIVISYIGMKTQHIVIKDKSPLKIILRNSTIGLDEVVVVGYGTQSKRTITAAITKVDGDVLKQAPISTVGEGLKGKVAGARFFSNNNTPGAEATIRIRGGSSINKSNDPLILVDGIERGLSGINPNDIESIQVLKDAASTAIYGSRASNGVILVTTKNGSRDMAPRITFEASVALQQTETSFDFMNAADYLNTVRPAVALGPHPEYNDINGFSASSGNKEGSIYSTRYLNAGETVPAGYLSMPDPLDPSKTLIFQDNNFQDEIYKNALWQNYYMGVDGGTDKVQYSTSLGYTDDGGVAIATGYSRLSMRNNINVKISDKLSFAGGFDYSKMKSQEYPNQSNIISRGLSTPATQRKYNDDGTPTKGYNATSPNPLWYKYYNDEDKTTKNLSIFGKLTYHIIPGLTADLQLSTFNRSRKADSFQRANEFKGSRPASIDANELYRDKLETYLTYKKNFKDHSLSVMAGYSYQKDKEETFRAEVDGASSDKVPTLTAGPNKKDARSSVTENVTIGYFGRISYDYKKRYLFSATLREDASSRFASGNQWGFFPGASVGWVMSDEAFMKNVKDRKSVV